MMLLSFFFLLLFTDSAISRCTHRDVVEHLNVSKGKHGLTLTQPAKNSSEPLELRLDVLLYAILDMNEKDQLFVSYIWVDVMWIDEMLSWNSSEFCGIDAIYIPTKSVWIPDLTIGEMTEKDKAAQTPYLRVNDTGSILMRNDMVVVSSCSMQVYKFPFDTQKCNLTFKSMIHSDKHLKLNQISNGERITKWSQKVMKSKAEWEFINMTFLENTEDNFGVNQSLVVYTITMKRRPILYIVNFLLPLLLLFCLDLSSLMIPEDDGGKIGFKISTLLAVVLMQLLLNEILPSSSNQIPLIVTYCVSIFSLMMVSLLEAILVMYLIRKDSAPQEKKADNESLNEDCVEKQGSSRLCCCFKEVELISCTSPSDWRSGETSSECLQDGKEGRQKLPSEGSNDHEKAVIKALSMLRNMLPNSEDVGYWTLLARRIHKVFIVLYLLTVTLILGFVFYRWSEGSL